MTLLICVCWNVFGCVHGCRGVLTIFCYCLWLQVEESLSCFIIPGKMHCFAYCCCLLSLCLRFHFAVIIMMFWKDWIPDPVFMQAELSLTLLQHMSVIENPTCKVLFNIKWSHWLKLLYMTCDGVFLFSVVVFFPRTDLQQIYCGEVTMQIVVWFCKLCKVLVMKVWTPFIQVCAVWAVNKSG